jgi:hypothetical protein
MKTLTYGNLSVTVDLDEHEEEILTQAIKQAMTMAIKHHEWVRRGKDE